MPIQNGLPSIIKSIQTISIPVTVGNGSAACAAVNPAKSVIIPLGPSSLGATYSFASSTLVNAALGSGNGNSWVQIIEYV